MTRKRSHAFHCDRCAAECMIYKKGRNHRVLVCPKCGVLATNPFSVGKAVQGAVTGAAAGAPIAGVGAIPGAVVGGLLGGISGKDKSPRSEGAVAVTSPSDRYTTQERVHDALRR